MEALAPLCSLKLECEKLVSEKTEMQRHYVMVSCPYCVPPCLPWVLSSGCWAPLRHSPKGATALPCADLGAGEMGGRKELITISSSAGFFFLLLSCCSVLLEPGNPAIGFVFFFFYLFLSGLVRELPTPPPLSP